MKSVSQFVICIMVITITLNTMPKNDTVPTVLSQYLTMLASPDVSHLFPYVDASLTLLKLNSHHKNAL